jgi:hypothetical protein
VLLVPHAAKFQFSNAKNPQPIIAEHADIELATLDVLFGDGGGPEPIVNEGDALCQLLVRCRSVINMAPASSALTRPASQESRLFVRTAANWLG